MVDPDRWRPTTIEVSWKFRPVNFLSSLFYIVIKEHLPLQYKILELNRESLILDQLNTKCSAWGAYQLIDKSQVVNLNTKAITVPWKTEWKIIRALAAASFEYSVDA